MFISFYMLYVLGMKVQNCYCYNCLKSVFLNAGDSLASIIYEYKATSTNSCGTNSC